MNKLEQSITTKWIMPWARKYRNVYNNHVIEAKYIHVGRNLTLNNFEPDQIEKMESAGEGFTFKIVDAGQSTFGDIISSAGQGFLGIYYEEQGLSIIKIENWDRKPLSWDRAKKIASHYYNI